ncbi:MAG: GT-D fold domain-containing glycosyltransferase [Blautia sp.]|nr:GT-D fold domain-containing glycosyltransferase [Blautia sp.]
MKKVYIWGAGYYAEYIYSIIDKKECEVVAIIDSDKNKQEQLWDYGLRIVAPDILFTQKFDKIFISVRNYEPVLNRCLEMGIARDKIVIYWQDNESIGLFENRAETILKCENSIYKYMSRLENAPYEFGAREIPDIQSSEQLLKKIIKEGKSLARFGDGEFEIMFQRERPWFQSVDDELSIRLREVIRNKNEGILIAIADNFGKLEKYKEDSADIIRQYMIKSRKDIMSFIDVNRVYYNAYVTRPYILYKDKRHASPIFDLFKKVWTNRNIILVEGKGGKIGVGNDLLQDAVTIRRIECPVRNAWDKYKDILESVRRVANKEDLICISLGPTATVLAYDLFMLGYQALDIGQVDIEYEWYIRNVDVRVSIDGKLVAEVDENFKESREFQDQNKEYENQVVYVIE